ncbi:Putative iron-sulfur cluster insertion protein ErpA OS=Castellaniella defragrans OX=75697 GN=erpA PE=3 SV=1 [Castellaniella defragrans]
MTILDSTDLQAAAAALPEFTDAAVARVRALMREKDNPRLKLRVYIQGGGCSGFQYGFSFEEVVGDDDALIEREGVALLVDSLSAPYLAGATIDFQEDLKGSQFVIHNPNANATCGCGSSFAP